MLSDRFAAGVDAWASCDTQYAAVVAPFPSFYPLGYALELHALVSV